MSACSVTVIRLVCPDAGVLCTIDLVLNVGTTTSSGCPPSVIPYLSPPGLVIWSMAIVPMLVDVPSLIDAFTLTEGDTVCVVVGFFSSNLIEQEVSFASLLATVSTRSPVYWVQLPSFPSVC